MYVGHSTRWSHAWQGFIQQQIAEKFGVNRSTIGKILRGERWKHA